MGRTPVNFVLWQEIVFSAKIVVGQETVFRSLCKADSYQLAIPHQTSLLKSWLHCNNQYSQHSHLLHISILTPLTIFTRHYRHLFSYNIPPHHTSHPSIPPSLTFTPSFISNPTPHTILRCSPEIVDTTS